MHPKEHKNYRDELYLKWIREQPSIVSGDYDKWVTDIGSGKNDAHHVWNTGKKGKRNDYLAVPLTRKEHQLYHQIGHKGFEEKFNINLEWCIINLMSDYLRGIHGLETE